MRKYLAFLLLVISTNIAMGNLISNGSFELGPDPDNHIEMFGGDTRITGWEVTGHSIDYNGTFCEHSDGNRSLDLVGHQPGGGIKQIFSTTPGQEYLVNFDMAGNCIDTGDPADNLRGLRITAAGQTSDEFIFDTTGHTNQDMGWVKESWSFVANNAQTTIEFYNTETLYTDHGASLDNVVVVPEPATLFLLGLGGLALRRKRRAK